MTCNNVEKSRFSCSVWTDNPNHRSRRNFKWHIWHIIVWKKKKNQPSSKVLLSPQRLRFFFLPFNNTLPSKDFDRFDASTTTSPNRGPPGITIVPALTFFLLATSCNNFSYWAILALFFVLPPFGFDRIHSSSFSCHKCHKGKLFAFNGNYSQWLLNKQKRLAIEERSEETKKRQLDKELEWIRSLHREELGLHLRNLCQPLCFVGCFVHKIRFEYSLLNHACNYFHERRFSDAIWSKNSNFCT